MSLAQRLFIYLSVAVLMFVNANIYSVTPIADLRPAESSTTDGATYFTFEQTNLISFVEQRQGQSAIDFNLGKLFRSLHVVVSFETFERQFEAVSGANYVAQSALLDIGLQAFAIAFPFHYFW